MKFDEIRVVFMSASRKMSTRGVSPVKGGVPMQDVEADGRDMPAVARREVA